MCGTYGEQRLTETDEKSDEKQEGELMINCSKMMAELQEKSFLL